MKKITLTFVLIAALVLSVAWPVMAQDPVLSLRNSSTQIVSSELLEYYSKLSPQVREKIDSGVMPSDAELKKMPKNLKEELKIFLQSQQAEQTEPNEIPSRGLFSEYGIEMIALILSVVGTVLAVTGFTFANAKKKKSTSKFLHEIDHAYTEYKSKSKRCEAELYRLQDMVEDHLKSGKIDDSTYHLLTNRIEKYLREIQEPVERSPLPSPVQATDEEA